MEKGEQMQGETEQCPGRGEERGMETSRETSLGGGGEKKEQYSASKKHFHNCPVTRP